MAQAKLEYRKIQTLTWTITSRVSGAPKEDSQYQRVSLFNFFQKIDKPEAKSQSKTQARDKSKKGECGLWAVTKI